MDSGSVAAADWGSEAVAGLDSAAAAETVWVEAGWGLVVAD